MNPSTETESFQIRNAFPSDADSIIAFNQAMARETEDRTLEDRIIRAGVQRIFDEPDQGFYLVAENEERIIGTLMVTREWSDWRNGVFWWLQSVYVQKSWRRCGVFRRLYQYVLEDSRNRKNLAGIRLYVAKENPLAQQVYQKVGLLYSGYHVYELDFTLPQES